jgi:hypothetical protein
VKEIKLLLVSACALAAVSTANAELVVVVNSKSSAATMTPAQIADVYLGKDSSFVPIDLPESAEQRAHFYDKVMGKTAAQVKTIWTRLVFTGKSVPPKEVNSCAEAVKQVGSNEKGIAYVDTSAVDASVKVVLKVQ